MGVAAAILAALREPLRAKSYFLPSVKLSYILECTSVAASAPRSARADGFRIFSSAG
jgi:hypothetical protein